MKSIAVFCGSNFGSSIAYRDAAQDLGHQLAARKIKLIYGGTQKGLMSVLADAVLKSGGEVHGVITTKLHQLGHAHSALKNLEVLRSMRERKARMIELADAFIALPGGLGTLEELFEVAALVQLGEHNKPCGVINVQGFYDPLQAMLSKAIQEEFMKPDHRNMIEIQSCAADLLEALSKWNVPASNKWID